MKSAGDFEMTNLEKFIEVMNKYFDAGLTKENLQASITSPN